MAIELVEKYLNYVDEQFNTGSKCSLVTNNDFSFAGAHSVKIYKVSTSPMYDYGRNEAIDGNMSRYGTIETLDATTELMEMKKDRSFTFVLDTLDMDETEGALSAASALARQIREVVVPEVDTYVFGVMTSNAGNKPGAVTLTTENIYQEIIKGSRELDNAEAPEDGRCLIVTPDTYYLMKQCKEIVMETEIGNDLRVKGIVSNLDGMTVMKVPANRLPEKFGFMIAHSCATVAPKKLESYRTHTNPPGINGKLCEGRIVYDAFVLENKAKAIYYQTNV